MSLDTLTKYPVQDSSKAVYHFSGSAVNFGNNLVVGGFKDSINDNNGSSCYVYS
jgi:hypothetical protein